MKFNSYQKIALTTVFATLFLIFVGGLVRAAGAGLGCPDWPRCFGLWIPPVSATELPPGYDPSQFSAFKTWLEYINRLVGVLVGMLITATFVLSLRYRKNDPAVFYSSLAAFLLVVFQGWLGGQVVISGLSAGLITLHMLLAVVIINTLLYAVFRASRGDITVDISVRIRKWLYGTGLLLLGVTLAQLVLGTQVREMVDIIKDAPDPPPRELWLAQVGWLDEFHRSFSWAVLGFGVIVFYISRYKTESTWVGRTGIAIITLIILQILVGMGLYYLGMPPAYQVFHLVGSVALVALEFLLLLLVKLPGS